ncbi:LytR/AlgR family response regulator transcription factor [Sandaracinus amylolyticus]|uniref:LytR/AlgR family response regulator transcription factor n=1 Tax=Sandaracinus amylolyticus TaxID=927083 RepID=UPI001F32CCCE|nr:LytTR family DNA-binding domain-containing protein [Sandaracinus amylolyticus]UJR84171.1 Hypothetical protein I5071_62420 [Sandaracinus amylolyticus]
MTERLRALVLEDEWSARSYLIELLHETKRVQVVAGVATLAQATEALAEEATLGLDVAFVDIRLASESAPDAGVAWIRSLEGHPSPPGLVIASASREYALEAYRLGVLDYVLKPYTAERVAQCVDRLVRLRAPRPVTSVVARRVVAREKRTLVFLDRDEVWAFEADARLSYVHCARGRLDLDVALTAIEGSLGPPFLRVHRNWLVNGDAVRGMARDSGETSLLVGSPDAPLRIPVARDRATMVRDALLEGAVGLKRS